jgi:hypothetical protein
VPEPTVANVLLEVLERPYFDDQPFTNLELLAIASPRGRTRYEA